MERPLWSGTLAFGIVTIPIRMMAAVRDHDVHFHQISRTDRKRIRYKKVAEGSDEEVDPADIVRGYAVKEGHYVVFDDEELARLGGAGEGRLADAADLLDRLVLDDDFAEFLTLRAYALL